METTKLIKISMSETQPKILSSPRIQQNYPGSNLVIRFKFYDYTEIHHRYLDCTSPDIKEHYDEFIEEVILSEDSSFGYVFVAPLKPETLEFYFACAEKGENWPGFVCDDVWKIVKEKVVEFLFRNVVFEAYDEEVGIIGLEMVAKVDVSTLVNEQEVHA